MNDPVMQQVLLGICGTLICTVGVWIGKNIQEARKSIEKLNISVAIVLEKISSHEVRITKLESKRKEK